MRAEYDTLLIGASFFGYAKEIKAALERRGHRVAWFEDRPSLDTATKILIRVAPRVISGRSEKYFDKILHELLCHPIERVFVIKGEALSVKSIHNFRLAFPKADFRLFFWDSYRNMPPDSVKKVSLFDRAFSSDPVDASSDPRLNYRPLFNLPQFFNTPEFEKDIDFLFVGTVHGDRFEVLERIKNAIPRGSRFVRFMYYPSRHLYYVKRFIRPIYWSSDPREFIFVPIETSQLLSLLGRTKIVIDIERTVQTGFTMRPIEMMAARRKIITTSTRIVDADFYRPSNALVIDRRNPVIPKEFLDTKFEALPAHVMYKYSLDTWVDEVLIR